MTHRTKSILIVGFILMSIVVAAGLILDKIADNQIEVDRQVALKEHESRSQKNKTLFDYVQNLPEPKSGLIGNNLFGLATEKGTLWILRQPYPTVADMESTLGKPDFQDGDARVWDAYPAPIGIDTRSSGYDLHNANNEPAYPYLKAWFNRQDGRLSRILVMGLKGCGEHTIGRTTEEWQCVR